MFKTVRRTLVIGVAMVSAIALLAGPASAHECFNASRADRANTAIAQHSHGWFDIQTSQILAILVSSCIQQPGPDCPPTPAPPLTLADVSYIASHDVIGEILGFAPPPQSQAVIDLMAFTGAVATEAACLGVPTHYLTLNNATAAGGAPSKNVTNGKGIDHFPDVYGQQLFTAYLTVLNNTTSACVS